MKILQYTNTMSSELLTKMEACLSLHKGSEIPLQKQRLYLELLDLESSVMLMNSWSLWISAAIHCV